MKFSVTRQPCPQSNFKINYYFCQSLKKSEMSTYIIINLFTPLLQIKLFWRNNKAFTRKCIIYLLVLYLKLMFPNFTSQLMSAVGESISCTLFFLQLCGCVQNQPFGGAPKSTCGEKRLQKFQQRSSFFN